MKKTHTYWHIRIGTYVKLNVFVFALTLALATTWSLYPDSCFSGRAGFSDLDPSDGGWSQNPMVTVYSDQVVAKARVWI